MKHWAARLIGKPYLHGADGPDAFDCWGLVRHVTKHHFGVDMPAIEVGETINERAIRNATKGWQQVSDRAEGNIVLMRSAIKLHCGIIVAGGVLHAVSGARVVHEKFDDATSGMSVTIWGRK